MLKPIAVNTANSEVVIPHWGVTLRTLFGACLDAWPEGQPGEQRDFTVVHKEKAVGVLHIKKHSAEPN